MEKWKVLNLYAGIGGNRKLWKNVEVTSVEINLDIAKIYQDFFPDDKVIIGDAHKYLLEHYEGFDFIWSSPPCPTHSRIRNIAGVGCGQNEPVYPDMRLYQEIIFLNQIYHSSGVNFNGYFCVENVASYYKPLITPQEIAGHYFWTNFIMGKINLGSKQHHSTIKEKEKNKGFDLNNIDLGHRKDTILRNCIKPELGKHVLDCAFKLVQTKIDKSHLLILTT